MKIFLKIEYGKGLPTTNVKMWDVDGRASNEYEEGCSELGNPQLTGRKLWC